MNGPSSVCLGAFHLPLISTNSWNIIYTYSTFGCCLNHTSTPLQLVRAELSHRSLMRTTTAVYVVRCTYVKKTTFFGAPRIQAQYSKSAFRRKCGSTWVVAVCIVTSQPLKHNRCTLKYSYVCEKWMYCIWRIAYSAWNLSGIPLFRIWTEDFAAFDVLESIRRESISLYSVNVYSREWSIPEYFQLSKQWNGT